MPAKTDQARKWAMDNFDSLQATAKPYSINDITNTLLNLVSTYSGGDSRLFLYSQGGIIFFFNINSSRNDVKSLARKVHEGGGLIFGSDFTNNVAKFIPILAIQPTEQQ